MLHNITLSADEFTALEKKPYFVTKPGAYQEGDGIIFTQDGTRNQRQYAITCVDPVFKSRVILGLFRSISMIDEDQQ